MALSGDLKTFMEEYIDVEKELVKSTFYEKAENHLTEIITNAEVSIEEKEKLLATFYTQIVMPTMQLAAEITRTAKASKAAERQAVWEELKAEAVVKKEYGYGNATIEEGLKDSTKDGLADANVSKVVAELRKNYGYGDAKPGDLGDSTEDGVVDKQIEGFDRDQFYKIAQIISQENGMLAQNDQSVPAWMVDVLAMTYEAMSNGKINLKATGSGDSRVVTANWNGSAKAPNGLGS